jgi:hypothetical protein
MAQTAARQGPRELARATLCLCAALNATALKDQGKGAALTCFVAYTRAREAQTERHLPPPRRPLSPIPFARIPDPGSGRTLEPPPVELS